MMHGRVAEDNEKKQGYRNFECRSSVRPENSTPRLESTAEQLLSLPWLTLSTIPQEGPLDRTMECRCASRLGKELPKEDGAGRYAC